MADDGFCLPDDVLVQILLLTPWSSRWPLRLVCKGWRDLIDERVLRVEKLAKILVFVVQGRSSSALVFDNKTGRRTHKWTYTTSSSDGGSSVYMVGTCNGLLCLHDHSSYGGAFSTVTVTNPITGETLAVPPLPARLQSRFVKAPGKYSFGFHPETGQHKVVYIPRGRRYSRDSLQVFTVGDKAWRGVEVPILGACHNLVCEPVSVDGSTYWIVAASSGEVMALDLKDERVTSFDAPPAMGPARVPSAAAAGDRLRLTKVEHAKLGLGVVVSVGMPSRTRVEVWVLLGLGGGRWRRKPEWSRRYSVVKTTPSLWVMAPQLTYGGWILSASRDAWDWRRVGTRTRLYRHKASDLMDGDDGRSRLLRPPKGAELNITKEESAGKLTTFAYVETRETTIQCQREILASTCAGRC